MSTRSPSSARRGSEPSRGFARPRPGRGLARVAMAFCLFAAANGQNVAGESGTFVDVTPNIQTQVDGRFGTAPSHRSGHTMVRPPADHPRARLVVQPAASRGSRFGPPARRFPFSSWHERATTRVIRVFFVKNPLEIKKTLFSRDDATVFVRLRVSVSSRAGFCAPAFAFPDD